jgi:hypothetical protein
MVKLLSPCFSNQISSLTNGDGTGDWSSMRDTLTNVFLGDNDLTELPKERSGNGNGDNNNGNNNNHHNGNGNGNGGGTDAANGSGASLAECRMLTWLNLDSNKVHYTGCLKYSIYCFQHITRRVSHPSLVTPRQKQGTVYRVFAIALCLCFQHITR